LVWFQISARNSSLPVYGSGYGSDIFEPSYPSLDRRALDWLALRFVQEIKS
jgi:hypothetical protein